MEDSMAIKPMAVPVRSEYLLHKYYIYLCDCGHTLQAEFNYCPYCGKELDWDEDYN